MQDDKQKMFNNIREQIKNPERREKDHIKVSKIWQTTQNIKSIQAELVDGYSFDKEKLTELVNAMFSFINGIVDPNVQEKESEVIVDEIVVN